MDQIDVFQLLWRSREKHLYILIGGKTFTAEVVELYQQSTEVDDGRG